MTRFHGYIAMSLDARIADAEGGLGWLTAFEGGPAGDFGHAAFYAGIDAAVMGRASYEAILGMPWPHPGKPTYVVTSRPLDPGRDDVIPVPPDFPALKARIVAEGRGAVWIVGGGRTQRAALDAGMLDTLRLFVMPLVLGGGPPVFAGGGMAPARLASHRAWPGGVIELNYEF